VGGRQQKAARAAGLKTNTQQLNRAARRDEDRPSHLADKKVSWLNLPLTVNVLKKLIAKVQDQLNTPVRQNPLRRRSHRSAAFHPAF
jgi:Mg2+/citrate symporter